MSRRRQRGLALVSVLWGISILSLIAAAMLSASLISAQLDRNVWSATRAASAADAAVNRAILSLLDERAGRQPRVDGTPFGIVFDGAPVRLWIQDESGKINLNFADKDMLADAFAAAGLAKDDAEALGARVVAWRTPPGDAPPRLFRDSDALLALPGMTPALYAKAAPMLSVYGKAGAVNPDVAPPVVLRLLPGMDARAIADRLKARGEAAPVAGPRAIPDSVFLITAEAHAGTARVVRVAAVMFTGDAANPYLVMAWR